MTPTIALVTDSSAQLAASLARSAGIGVVPVTVRIDGEELDETVLDVDAFYERLAAGAEATTATPGPGAFALAYEAAAAAGAAEVISLHLDERLSAIPTAARLGAADSPIPVRVVDTGQVSFGVALCALTARRSLDGGADAATAVVTALDLAARLRNASFVAVTPTPGRVGVRNALVAVSDGSTVVLETAAAPAAVDRLVAHVLESAGPLGVAVGHAGPGVREPADRLAATLRRERSVREVVRYRVGPSVGAHTGPDAFGCFWWPSEVEGEAYPGIGLD
ncbi:MAG: DegV family protein [Thermoleophilia bacterium]|nr:DegV family protein [Thermoleophilia bacterium]